MAHRRGQVVRLAQQGRLDDRAAGAAIGAESLAFVREHQDGRKTGAALASILQG